MKLSSGVRLGPYEIVAPIGAGGMGEVYQARDTRLGRIVAIKTLPAEFQDDARLKIRFEREAKAISALNHPHICALYDVGPDYLVMEHCEGKTLAKRIGDGPLPLDQVFNYGVQIADALEKAHRQGIIHRDLKPSNVILTKTGVKLLDFGLAKQHVVSSPDESTVEQVTEEGKILGTIQYMAPEVLHGREADARSDIFALGLVMYEMVTGRPAFSGTSKATLIAAIVDREPLAISETRENVPPALEHIIARCLAKEPDDRWQSAHDIAAELRWIASVGQPSAATLHSHPRAPRRFLWLAGVIVAIAIAIAGLWMMQREKPQARSQRFELQPPEGLWIAPPGTGSVVAISPDGEWIAFRANAEDAARNGLYLRSTRELSTRRIGPGVTPFFSPDSKWLGFSRGGYLQKVPVAGGEPERICSVTRPRGASWGEDGSILFSAEEGLLRVAANGGKPQVVVTPPGGQLYYWPQLLPGGKKALFTLLRSGLEASRDVALLDLRSGAINVLVSGANNARYVAGGFLVFNRAGALYAAKYDAASISLGGDPVRALGDVHYYAGSSATGYDVGRSGELVYVPVVPAFGDGELVWIDRTGTVEPVLEEKRAYETPSLSPDEKKIAVTIRTSIDEADLWEYELETQRWRRVTTRKGVEGWTFWTPDQQSIMTGSTLSGHPRVVRVSVADGSVEQLTSGAGFRWDYTTDVSPDGRLALVMRQTPKINWDILALSLTPPRGKLTPVVVSETWKGRARFSPDGRWLVYQSNETSGADNIHIRPFPGPGTPTRVSTNGGGFPIWSAAGDEVIYQKGREVWVARVATAPQLKVGSPKLLFTLPWTHDTFFGGMPMTRDGKRFLAIRPPSDGQRERRIVYVPNWSNELQQLVGKR